MINMAFMPLYMWEMWDVTPVTHRHTDEQWKLVQYSVWAESAIINIHRLCIRSDVQLFGREVGAWLEYSCHSTQPYLCQAGDDDDGDDDDDGEDDDKEEEDENEDDKSGHHPNAYLDDCRHHHQQLSSRAPRERAEIGGMVTCDPGDWQHLLYSMYSIKAFNVFISKGRLQNITGGVFLYMTKMQLNTCGFKLYDLTISSIQHFSHKAHFCLH